MRVLVAENDPLHRAFVVGVLRDLLNASDEIREAEDGLKTMSSARSWAPDGLILDLQMPNATGVEAAKAIWADKPDTRILFWSNYADESYVRGVDRIVPPQAVYGYVLKSASEERLRFAIHGVLMEEQCVIDPEVRGIQRRAEDRHEGLTDAEYNLLFDIALGMTDRAIALRRGLSTRSVQSHLRQLYCKFGLGDCGQANLRPLLNSRTRAILIAFARGLINVENLRQADARLQRWLNSVNRR